MTEGRNYSLSSRGSKQGKYWTGNGFLHQIMTDGTYSPERQASRVAFIQIVFVVYEILEKVVDQNSKAIILNCLCDPKECLSAYYFNLIQTF